jgi:hypothetical protein
MRKLAAVAVIATLVMTACGGSSKPKGAKIGGTPTTRANGSGGSGSDGGGSSNSGSSDFEKLLAAQSKAKVRVTYTSTGNGSGTAFTISQDGSGKIAYFSDDGDSQIIADGDKTITCSSVKTTPSCIEQSGALAQAAILPFTAILSLAKSQIEAARGTGGGFGDTTSETIAGRDAECVSVNIAGAGWKACADKQTGIMLRWEAGAGGSMSSLEATEVGDPKDSDFTPPATPETVPGLGG